MSNELEMSAPSPTDQIDYTKHRGVRKTKSGKWGAAIRHPITKASVWLGSYNTPKEAADVFNKKQLEYQSLAGTKGFKNRKSFIQGAKIQDLGIKESVCLVTCNYAEDSVVSYAAVEETEDARNRKMCEANFIDQAEMNSNETRFHDNGDAVAHSSKVTNQMSADLAEAVGNTEVAIHAKRLPGSGSISRQKSGRWRAQLRYRNSNVHMGVYNTYEEAEAALDKKRQELDSVACVEVVANEPVNMELMFNQTPEKQESIIKTCGEEDSAQVVSSTDVAMLVKRLPGSGSINRTKGGRWQARISSGKSRVYLGNYNTYEEAEGAIHKKRQELDSVAQVEEEDRTTTTTTRRRSKEPMALVGCNRDPRNQTSFIRPRGVFLRKSGRWTAEIRHPVTKWRGSVGTYDTAEQALEALNRKRREFDLLKDADKKCKKTIYVAEEELQAQSGTTANCKVELKERKADETAVAVEDIECGDCCASVENIQSPCSSFDNSVIDAYGQLVGEFSRLDDDLWLVESLDDVVEK